MGINWEVVLWTCITLAVILGIIGLILVFISAKNVRKRRKELGEVHTELRVGSQVMISGGIYGKITGIEEETVNVELARGPVFRICLYGIQSFLEENKLAVYCLLMKCGLSFNDSPFLTVQFLKRLLEYSLGAI